MTPRITCPACDGPLTPLRETHDFTFRERFRLVRCTTCTLVTVDPVPDAAELARYYADGFYGQPSSTSGAALRLFYARREALVRRHRPRLQSLLDVGCGDGGFLAHMAARGVGVAGFEPSAAGAARARARLLDVADNGRVGVVDEDLDVVAGEFDVVTAWQVLEHVAEPRPFLARLQSLLAPGGVAIISVPNIESLEARLGGDAWFHLDVPRHLHHFSPASLRRLVTSSGFDVVDVDSFSIEYGPFGLLQTALNALPIERNALYQLAKHGRPLSSFPLATSVAMVAGAAVGGAAAVVGSAVQAALGRGSTIAMTLRTR